MNATLLPPAKGSCPACGHDHPPEQPHNVESMYYQYRFYGLRQRWPTWADAVAHCSDHVREHWQTELTRMKRWTEPEAGEPIADPPGESIAQPVDMSDVMKMRVVPLHQTPEQQAADRERIKQILLIINLDCSDEQAAKLHELVGPLPQGDHEVMNALSDFISVDWDKMPDKLEPALRDLEARYNAAPPNQRGHIELTMMAYTKGLIEHPSWWNFPCLCDTCVSYMAD